MVSPHELLYCRLGKESIHGEWARVYLAYFVQDNYVSLG